MPNFETKITADLLGFVSDETYIDEFLYGDLDKFFASVLAKKRELLAKGEEEGLPTEETARIIKESVVKALEIKRDVRDIELRTEGIGE